MAIGVSQGTELRFQGFFDVSGNIFEKLIVIHRWLSSFCVVVQAGLETEKAPDGGWSIRRYVRENQARSNNGGKEFRRFSHLAILLEEGPKWVKKMQKS